MTKDNRGSGFFAGFLIGGIVVTVVWALLSQKDDQSTLKVRLKDMISQGKEAIREAIEEGREAAARKEAEIRGDLKKED